MESVKIEMGEVTNIEINGCPELVERICQCISKYYYNEAKGSVIRETVAPGQTVIEKPAKACITYNFSGILEQPWEPSLNSHGGGRFPKEYIHIPLSEYSHTEGIIHKDCISHAEGISDGGLTAGSGYGPPRHCGGTQTLASPYNPKDKI